MGIKLKHLLTTLFLTFCLGSFGQSDSTRLHEVKPGETKYSISRQYNITIEQLEQFNPEIEGGLKAGSTLLIPVTLATQITADAAQQDSGFIYITVKPQQTLYSLSKDYGVSIAALRENNPALDDGLKIDMRLKIPVSEYAKVSALKTAEEYFIHEVAPKQTAYAVSKKYNLSLDSLYLLNPDAEAGLQIGQRLRIPKRLAKTNEQATEKPTADPKPKEQLSADEPKAGVDTASQNYLLYKVKTGDSFYALKRNFNVEREALLKLNPELANGLIVGKYILIPKNQTAQKTSWLDKLFNKVEDPIAMEPVESETTDLKDSLNVKASTPAAAKSEERDSTIKIDISKTYRVAVMLPFNASQRPDTVFFGQKMPEIGQLSRMSLDYYQGFLLAAEKLTRQGMNLNLQVLDSEQSQSTVELHLQRIEKNQADLLIGPALKQNVEFAADKLAHTGIPVISPLSNAVSVAGRPNLIQVVPTVYAKDARIAELLNNHFTGANIVFVHDGKSISVARAKRIKARLEPRYGSLYLKEIELNENNFSDRGVLSSIKKDSSKTAVVSLVDNPATLSDLTRRLYSMRDTSLYLIGSNRLTQLETVELDYLNRLKFMATDVLFTNYEDTATQNFIETYRKRFKADPNHTAMQGYDVGLYFLEKLWKEGLYFTATLEAQKAEVKTTSGFKMSRQGQGGFENDYLFLTRMRQFKMMRMYED